MAAKKKPAGKAAPKKPAAKPAASRKPAKAKAAAPRRPRKPKASAAAARELKSLDGYAEIRTTDVPGVVGCRAPGKPLKHFRWDAARCVWEPCAPPPQHVVLPPVPAEEIERRSEDVRKAARTERVPYTDTKGNVIGHRTVRIDTTEGADDPSLRHRAPRRLRVSRWVLVAAAIAAVVVLSLMLTACTYHRSSLQPPRADVPPVSCASQCMA